MAWLREPKSSDALFPLECAHLGSADSRLPGYPTCSECWWVPKTYDLFWNPTSNNFKFNKVKHLKWRRVSQVNFQSVLQNTHQVKEIHCKLKKKTSSRILIDNLSKTIALNPLSHSKWIVPLACKLPTSHSEQHEKTRLTWPNTIRDKKHRSHVRFGQPYSIPCAPSVSFFKIHEKIHLEITEVTIQQNPVVFAIDLHRPLIHDDLFSTNVKGVRWAGGTIETQGDSSDFCVFRFIRACWIIFHFSHLEPLYSQTFKFIP